MILSGLYISKEILLDSGLVYHLFCALFADESNGKQCAGIYRRIACYYYYYYQCPKTKLVFLCF